MRHHAAHLGVPRRLLDARRRPVRREPAAVRARRAAGERGGQGGRVLSRIRIPVKTTDRTHAGRPARSEAWRCSPSPTCVCRCGERGCDGPFQPAVLRAGPRVQPRAAGARPRAGRPRRARQREPARVGGRRPRGPDGGRRDGAALPDALGAPDVVHPERERRARRHRLERRPGGEDHGGGRARARAADDRRDRGRRRRRRAVPRADDGRRRRDRRARARLRPGGRQPLPRRRGRPSRPTSLATIVYTSGTTGDPEGRHADAREHRVERRRDAGWIGARRVGPAAVVPAAEPRLRAGRAVPLPATTASACTSRRR